MSHTRENDIIDRLEEIYQSRNISLTFLVVNDSSGVDLSVLEDLLTSRTFPLNRSLYLIDGNDFIQMRDLAGYEPDCIVIVENTNVGMSKSFEVALSMVSHVQHSIIVSL